MIVNYLLNILNWSKHPTPVVSSYTYEGEYGPGHNSFYVENNEISDVYHAKEAFSNSPRFTGIPRVPIAGV